VVELLVLSGVRLLQIRAEEFDIVWTGYTNIDAGLSKELNKVFFKKRSTDDAFIRYNLWIAKAIVIVKAENKRLS
jgi:hypothetical protein